MISIVEKFETSFNQSTSDAVVHFDVNKRNYTHFCS